MNKLQEIRKDLGYTQEEIAKKLDISQQAYASYERNINTAPKKMIEKIANILEVDETTFFYNPSLENNSLVEFLYKSLTPFHAVKNVRQILEEDGFKRLDEHLSYSLKKGDKYYLTKNNSAIIAFKVGDTSKRYYYHIASCHTDSPCLKIKGNKLIASKEGKLINIERYGGLINYSFLDTPLKIAGRAFIKENNSLKEVLVNSDYLVNIPSLCIHHNSRVNEGVELSYQSDMLPLLGECDDLYKSLLKEEIVDADLFVVPFLKPTYVGRNSEYLLSPRIDNLSSLYAIVHALINLEDNEGISILYASDNEEIGSLSKQGAESIFLIETLKRINRSLGKNQEDYYLALTNSFVLSIDNGHAVHQAQQGKADPVNDVTLNKGIVIKHHSNYATDGLSSASIKLLADSYQIPYQDYYNNSNVRCGSTIGLVTSAQLGVNTIDIGLAQLAMHSAKETVGKKDYLQMMKLVKVFFENSFTYTYDSVTLNKKGS